MRKVRPLILAWVSVIGLGLVPLTAYAQSRPAGTYVVGEGTYHVLLKENREILREATWTVRREGADSIYEARGEGRYAGETERVQWHVKARFNIKEPTQLRESIRTVWTAHGNQVRKRIRRSYDPEEGSLTVQIEEPALKRQDQVKRWTRLDGVVTRETLTFVIRESLSQDHSLKPFLYLTDAPRLIRLRPVAVGEETVTVPDGVFPCLKIKLQPEAALVRLLGRIFLPKTWLWHTSSPPHLWVQYEGVENDKRTRHVVIERTSLLLRPDS